MKKFFTLIFTLLLALGVTSHADTNWEVNTAKPTQAGTYNEESDCPIYFGTFNTSLKKSTVWGFAGYYEGNTNPSGFKVNSSVPTGGSYVSFSPKTNGSLYFACVVNSGKNFYIVDENAAPLTDVKFYTPSGDEITDYTNGDQFGSKYTGLKCEFNVESGKTYYALVSGSKIGFYGYNFTADPDAPVIPTLSNPEINVNTTTGLVTITQAENGNVYYTTDGSTPTVESTLYDEPFTVSDATTIHAIAIGDGENSLNSAVVSTTVYLDGVTIETPVINSINGTFYIACSTPGVKVEYSYDGETWNTFTKAITLMEKDETVYARASREGCQTTETVSADVKVLLPAVTPDKTICIGHGSFTSNSKETYYMKGTPNVESSAYGFNIRMGDENAKYSAANKIYMYSKGETRTGIKGANGAQNILEIPENLMVTRITLYSYVNYANSIVGWSEINGEPIDYTAVPMGCMPGIDVTKEGNADVRVFNFDNATGEITFTATGTQVVYTLDVDVIHKTLENANHGHDNGYKYTEGETISFTHEIEGVEVLYTLDGNDPDPDNVYVAPAVEEETPEVEPAAVRARVAEEHNGRTYSHTSTPLVYNGEPMRVKYMVTKQGYKNSEVWELNVGTTGETTGIEEIAVDTEAVDAPVYNIYGQRVDATYRGIVIKNGHKYIQK